MAKASAHAPGQRATGCGRALSRPSCLVPVFGPKVSCVRTYFRGPSVSLPAPAPFFCVELEVPPTAWVGPQVCAAFVHFPALLAPKDTYLLVSPLPQCILVLRGRIPLPLGKKVSSAGPEICPKQFATLFNARRGATHLAGKVKLTFLECPWVPGLSSPVTGRGCDPVDSEAVTCSICRTEN